MNKAKTRTGNSLPRRVPGYGPDFGERLSRVITEIGALADAGRVAGVSDDTLAAWRDGTTRPNLFGIIKLADASGYAVQWIATGEGKERHEEMLLTDDRHREWVGLPSAKSELLSLPAGMADELVMIRKLEVQASAGSGALAVQDEDESGALEFIALQASWLRAKNINPSACRILTARGDSMEPTIRDGDVMIIDTSIDQAKDNMIYIFVFDGMVFVKRLHKRMTGALLLMSDNPLYPAEEIAVGDVQNLHIAGRLVWAGRFY